MAVPRPASGHMSRMLSWIAFFYFTVICHRYSSDLNRRTNPIATFVPEQIIPVDPFLMATRLRIAPVSG